jgi:methylenetetrahydrofolate reductase (NADPH)
MKVGELYKKAKKPVFSIEVSPPLNGGSLEPIFNTIDAYKEFEPAWCSVTCGALGRPRGGTIPISGRIKREREIETVPHFISVGKSEKDIENLLMDMKYEGIENVLALRGDFPNGNKEFSQYSNKPKYAYELVRQIRLMNEGKYLAEKEGEYCERSPADFCISVAGHPEGHPQCPDKKTGLGHLQMKVDEGADYITTQLFFNADHYFRFVEDARKMGIQIPVIPGVMPIGNWSQLNFILNQKLGLNVPKKFVEKLKKYHDDGDVISAQKFGTEYIASMCETLINGGAPGIHLYTMNSPTRGRGVIEAIYASYFAPKITWVEYNQAQLHLGGLLYEADEIRETIRKAQSGELQKRLEGIAQEHIRIKARQEEEMKNRETKELDEIRETIRKAQSGELQKRLEEIVQEHDQTEVRLEQAVEETPPKITWVEYNQAQLHLGGLLYEADEIRETIRKVQSGELQKRLEEIVQEHDQTEARLEQAVESLPR